MKKLVYTFLILLGSITSANSQALEFGILLGGSNYQGDLTDGGPLLDQTNFAGGLLLRYNHTPYITLRASALYGRIEGADANYPDIPERYNRNLSFRSDVIEFSGQVEWNILGFGNGRKASRKPGRLFSPFLFGGIGIFKFNPKALYNDEWVELQPLRTEGQGTTKYNDRQSYPLTQVAVPLGFGIKVQVSSRINFGVEVGYRKLFTDYLDDISLTYVEPQIIRQAYGQTSEALADRSGEISGDGLPTGQAGTPRGDDKKSDWYMIGGVTITYKIYNRNNPCPRFR